MVDHGKRLRFLMAKQGRAVQVDPIKPTLKAPGTKRLKLEYDDLLSIFGFEFNLRRHSKGNPPTIGTRRAPGRGLHSFRFQLNLSSSVHHVTQLIS
jgi:hypothetical protein